MANSDNACCKFLLDKVPIHPRRSYAAAAVVSGGDESDSLFVLCAEVSSSEMIDDEARLVADEYADGVVMPDVPVETFDNSGGGVGD
jgi:hypothetical protein